MSEKDNPLSSTELLVFPLGQDRGVNVFIPAVLRVILLVISLLLFELSATISISEDPKIASFSLSQDILLLGETMLNAEPGEGMLYPGE